MLRFAKNTKALEYKTPYLEAAEHTDEAGERIIEITENLAAQSTTKKRA